MRSEMATFESIVSVANDGGIVQALFRLCCKVTKTNQIVLLSTP